MAGGMPGAMGMPGAVAAGWGALPLPQKARRGLFGQEGMQEHGGAGGCCGDLETRMVRVGVWGCGGLGAYMPVSSLP